MKRAPLLLLLALPLVAIAPPATLYEVGPGRGLTSINNVPWESLWPGDVVQIHWKASPYKEKWVICRSGITVMGMPGPNGQRPVIDGNGATTRLALNFWNEERGIIKIGGASIPPDTLPTDITIQGLEIRSGRPGFSFTGDDGTVRSYASNAAAIYVEKAENLTIRDCVLRDSGNGLFVGSNNGQSKNILIEKNYLYDNGIENSALEHNSYTESTDITFQYNHYGPLRANCDGNNLKDRSAGLVARYNWIEGGNRQLDLVDSGTLAALPQYRQTFVYGNILIEPDGAGNSQILHYGGDSGNTADYRKGWLYFYNNTLVSTRSGNTTLLRLSSNGESADCRNNILYVPAGGNKLAMLNDAGTLHLKNNWTRPGWVNSHSGLTGTITDLGGAITGSAPGFVDEAGQNYRLTGTSNCVNAGTAQHAVTVSAHPVDMEYIEHQKSEARGLEFSIDLGAYETISGGGGVPPPVPGPPPSGGGDGGGGGSCGLVGLEALILLGLIRKLAKLRR